MQNITPMVSICCQTYNHKDYIIEALEGFLMQKTNFPFEILLRDDASTDGTAEICREYAQNHPNIIKLLAYEENQWSKGVSPFRDNVKRAKGKYIAMCEGDDYWTDPLKLQKQVDFLEDQDQYVLSTHAIQIVDAASKPTGKTIPTKETEDKFYDIYDILESKDVQTCSFMFKNDKQFYKDTQFLTQGLRTFGDVAIMYWFAYQGGIHHMNQYMSSYRINPTSLTSYRRNFELQKRLPLTRKREEDFITLLSRFRTLVDAKAKLKRRLNRKIGFHYYNLADYQYLSEMYTKSLSSLMRGIYYYPFFILKKPRLIISLLSKSLLHIKPKI